VAQGIGSIWQTCTCTHTLEVVAMHSSFFEVAANLSFLHC